MTKKTEEVELDFDLKTLNLFNIDGRDTDAEEAGKWFDYEYTNDDGVKIKVPEVKFKIRSIASNTGSKYHSIYAKLEREAKTASVGKLDTKQIAAIGIKAIIKSELLIDWQGVKTAEGVEVPFKYAEKVLSSPYYDFFSSYVIDIAVKPRIFREEAKEESTKN